MPIIGTVENVLAKDTLLASTLAQPASGSSSGIPGCVQQRAHQPRRGRRHVEAAAARLLVSACCSCRETERRGVVCVRYCVYGYRCGCIIRVGIQTVTGNWRRLDSRRLLSYVCVYTRKRWISRNFVISRGGRLWRIYGAFVYMCVWNSPLRSIARFPLLLLCSAPESTFDIADVERRACSTVLYMNNGWLLYNLKT